MDKIIGIGNALVDALIRLESDDMLKEFDLPKGSMQLIQSDLNKKINDRISTFKVGKDTGGSAGNTIRALGCLGIPTSFIGKIGDDSYGNFYKRAIEKENVESQLLIHPNLPTGVANTFISPGGQRTFATFLGAGASLTAEDLNLKMFQNGCYFYIEGYLVQNHELMKRAISLAKQANLLICLDLASYNIVHEDKDFFKKMIIEDVDILFANKDEAKAITGFEATEAIEVLANECKIVIVKIGKKGALIARGEERVHVNAIWVDEVVDTTGAGDSFAAGFLYGLATKKELRRCGEIGSLLAGYVIQYLGASIPDKRLRELQQEVMKID